MSVFSRKDVEREGVVEDLLVLVCADSTGVAVGEQVLGGNVSTIDVAFEERDGFLDSCVCSALAESWRCRGERWQIRIGGPCSGLARFGAVEFEGLVV